MRLLTICVLCIVLLPAAQADLLQQRIELNQAIQQRVTPWNVYQNRGVVRQSKGSSCGAAAVATLLTYYYGLPVSEKAVLDATGKDGWLSFADMEKVMEGYGFKVIGLALDFAQLRKLKIPVIVFIRTLSSRHFAVLRGINDQYVELADPAHGNNRYPLSKFLEKWNTRDDAHFKGKILVALPTDRNRQHLSINPAYFNANPGNDHLYEQVLRFQQTLLMYSR